MDINHIENKANQIIRNLLIYFIFIICILNNIGIFLRISDNQLLHAGNHFFNVCVCIYSLTYIRKYYIVESVIDNK